MSRFVLFAILLIGPFAQVEKAGEGYFSAGNLRPLVGEPVEISLVVTLPPGSTVTAWPDFSAQWADFEVDSVGELTITEIGDGLVEYRQTVTARLWEPGDFETPETTIGYQPPDEVSASEITVQPAFFTVPSVLKSEDEPLAPAKAPVYLAYVPPWLAVVVLFLAIAGAMVGIDTWRVRYRRRRSAGTAEGDIHVLGQRTLALLHRIDSQMADSAAVYALVADGLREYLRDYYGVAATEMTTGELLRTLQYELPESHLSRLQQLLGQADLVKFARYRPDSGSAERYLEAAVRWLQTMMREQGGQPEHEGEAA